MKKIVFPPLGKYHFAIAGISASGIFVSSISAGEKNLYEFKIVK